MADLSGQSIGRYQVIERLGEGGMATVYRAFDTRLDCDVAIKVIRRENIPPNTLERFRKRFEREAKVLARLNHPNIVAVSDYGEFDGAPYLVMRYMSGGTLRKKMDHVFTPGEAAGLLLPVARALDYAHHQHILHRDVKPANILLTETGEPVLSDFGIARLLEGDEGHTLTGTGVGIGTPDYMAPEQSTGSAVDARADIYSLGVLFYEMVTGRKPFEGDTPIAVMIKHAYEPLPSPRKLVPAISAEVDKTLYKALAKKPEERYANMGEFAAALETITRAGTGSKEKKSPPKAVKPRAPQGKAPASLAEKTPPTAPPSVPSQLEVTTDTPSPAALPVVRVRAPSPQRIKRPLPRWLIFGVPAVLVIALIAGIVFAFPGLFARPGENTSQPTALSAVGTGIASPTALSIAATGMASPTSPNTQATSPSPAAQATFTPSPQPAQPNPAPTATLAPGPAIDRSNAASLVKLTSQDYTNLYDAQPIPGTGEMAVITDAATSSSVDRVSIDSLVKTGPIKSIYLARAMAISPDGKIIALADVRSGKFRLVNLADQQEVVSINGVVGVDGFINGIAFSSDGKWIAETMMVGAAKVHEVATGDEISTNALKDNYTFSWTSLRYFSTPNSNVCTVAFSPDGKILAAGGEDGQAYLWDASTGKKLAVLDPRPGDKQKLLRVFFSPRGDRFVTVMRSMLATWSVPSAGGQQ